MLGLSFPRAELMWLAYLALFPLMMALRLPETSGAGLASTRTSFRLGYLAGAIYFAILLHWIPLLPQENVTIPFIMVPALVLMVAYLSLFPALVCAASAFLARRGIPIWLTFPIFWVFSEVLRSIGPLGFPWGVIAYAGASSPHLIQFAEYTGMWGVSFWLASLSAMVYGYLSLRDGRAKALLVTLLLASVLGPFFHGRWVISSREPTAAVRVGIIQPNTGNDKWKAGVRDSVVVNLLRETTLLADEWKVHPPVVILWPETAVPARLPREPYVLYQVEALVADTGIPLLAGFPDGENIDGVWNFTNSAGLFLPGQGMVDRYDKQRLVPFSERFPVPFLNRFDFGQANFKPGKLSGLMDALDRPFGVLICFESIFPGPARKLTQEGAEYLVNITNDQWFGDSSAPYQHFNMNVLRCIENRRALARAANTGISGVIDPYGFVRERTMTFVPDRTVVQVELTGKTTLYTRAGDWILLALAGILVLGSGVSLLGRRR